VRGGREVRRGQPLEGATRAGQRIRAVEQPRDMARDLSRYAAVVKAAGIKAE
jgi:hypothetical protein